MFETKNTEHHLARPGKFFGVYILHSNSKQRGDVYIGFTVNPQRRIRQHNREIKGGAWKTGKNKGTWNMVLITHGFPTRLSALQFEWAWQNPQKSKRLSHLSKKTSKETKFTYKLRILSEMLNRGPWYRLPLTIQWLKQEYQQQFPIAKQPPIHMPIAYGPIITVKNTNSASNRDKTIKENCEGKNDAEVCAVHIAEEEEEEEEEEAKEIPSQAVCDICKDTNISKDIQQIYLHCIVKSCNLVAHMKCLASSFLCQEEERISSSSIPTMKISAKKFLIPVSGRCPMCDQELMWGDILKQRKYSMDVEEDDEDDGGVVGESEDTQEDYEDTTDYSQRDNDEEYPGTQSQEF